MTDLVDIFTFIEDKRCKAVPVNSETNEELINILDFNKNIEYKCKNCSCKIYYKNGPIKSAHWSHYNTSNSSGVGESEIHKKAKEKLKKLIEKNKVEVQRKCFRCHELFDVKIPKYENSYSIVIEGYLDEKKRADIVMLDKEEVKFLFEVWYTHKTPERPGEWVDLSAEEILGNSLKKFQCARLDKCCSYCESCENKIQINVTQMGAGTGKTYQAVQKLEDDKEIFTHIYLCKPHSEKHNIYCELKDQQNTQKITDLEIINDIEAEHNRKFKIKFNDKEKYCIIATTDSFFYAIVDKSKIEKTTCDPFLNICNSIAAKKFNPRLKIEYAGTSFYLSPRCRIIQDEGQSLPVEYFQAFKTLVEETKIQFTIIGDKLQSLIGIENAFKYFNSLSDKNAKKYTKPNIIRRFHNKKLMEFVNKHIQFSKYNLPEIEGVCPGDNCKLCEHKIVESPTVFYTPNIVSYEEHQNHIDFVEQVITYMRNDVEKYKLMPKNFMCIFPVLTGNTLARLLCTKIENFWKKKFQSENKLENGRFTEYCVLHSSDSGRPIDLKESENSTRILTIHSSKGLGAEIVFTFLSEQKIRRFSKNEDEQYESFVHVSLTRAKLKMYVGFAKNNDEINRRFQGIHIEENSSYKPSFSDIKTTFLLDSIIEDVQRRNFLEFKQYDLNLEILKKDNYEIIDTNHHNNRFSAMLLLMTMKFARKFLESEKRERDEFAQIYKILEKLKEEYRISICDNLKVYNDLIIDLKKEEKNRKIIPVFKFYGKNSAKFASILYNILNRVKSYGRTWILERTNIRTFCILEFYLLHYLIEITKNYSYKGCGSFHMAELYAFMQKCFDTYDCCENCYKFYSNEFPDKKCIVEKCREKTAEHYKEIEKLEKLWDFVTEKYFSKEKCEFHIFHYVMMEEIDRQINIQNTFKFIVNNETNIFVFIIKPNISEFDISKLIIACFFQEFILKKCTRENNKERYHDKEVIFIVLALNLEKPLEINLKNFNHPADAIRKNIFFYLEDKYKFYNNIIAELYSSKGRNFPIKEIWNIPKYMKSTWESDNTNNDNILQKLDNKLMCILDDFP